LFSLSTMLQALSRIRLWSATGFTPVYSALSASGLPSAVEHFPAK
jgi:hypothetical protein